MTQSPSDSLHDTPPAMPVRRLWPLSRVFWIDLLIVLALILVLNIFLGIYMLIQASNSGLIDFSNPSAGVGQLTEAKLTALIGTWGIVLFVLAQNAVFVAVPVLRVRWLRHEPLSSIGFQASRPLKLVAIGIALGIVILILNALISTGFASIGIQQNQAAQYPLYPGDYLGQIAFFLAAAVAAPIGEEVLIRGYAFNAFRSNWKGRGGLIAAFVVSAALFMTAHALSATSGLIALLVPTFIMGLLLAASVYRTNSLVPAIVAHSLNNSVALLALLVCVNNPGASFCSAI